MSEIASFMENGCTAFIQTEAQISERYTAEPKSLLQGNEPLADVEAIQPRREPMPAQPQLTLEQAKPEKVSTFAARKDWANSPLFDCVLRSHSAILMKQGAITEKDASELGIAVQIGNSSLKDLQEQEVLFLGQNLK